MRLLTEERIREIIASFMPGLEEHLKHIKLDAHIKVADEEHKETLKAVGEWLEQEIYGAELELRVEDALFLYGLAQRLQNGEMPEEGK